MRKFRVVLLLFTMIIFVLFVRSVTALDTDGDTIRDEFDMCPNTNIADSLPIIRNNPEFFGCSCDQIYEKLGYSSLCYDIYCLAGRPLTLSKRLSTKEMVDCGPDYCDKNTLYEFSDPSYAQCIDGKIVEDFCKPKITYSSNLCINGEIPQKQSLQNFDIKITDEQSYVQQEKSIDYFSIIQDNPELRVFLGNPSKKEFDYSVQKTSDSVTLSRVVSRKRVGNTEATIPYVSIIIKPKDAKELKNVVVIETLISDYRSDSFIFYDNQPLIIKNTGEFAWFFDSIKEQGIIINYQLNEPVELPAKTLVVGIVKRKSLLTEWWPLLLIPIIGYFAFKYITSSNKD